MSAAGRVFAGLALLALGACASPALAPPEPTLANLQAVRGARMAPSAVGEFKLAAGLTPGMDRSVAVRASSQAAPGGSFARHLGETLAAELRGAGRLDPGSRIVISGELTESSVSSSLPHGHAALGATFRVTRGGKLVFEKPLRVEDSWRSAFLGAEAIPDALNHYTALYPTLVGVLVSDPDFAAAVRDG